MPARSTRGSFSFRKGEIGNEPLHSSRCQQHHAHPYPSTLPCVTVQDQNAPGGNAQLRFSEEQAEWEIALPAGSCAVLKLLSRRRRQSAAKAAATAAVAEAALQLDDRRKEEGGASEGVEASAPAARVKSESMEAPAPAAGVKREREEGASSANHG
jgi:hypothetical protein